VTRAQLEHRWRAYKIRIITNVGPSSGHRWSVETAEGSPLGHGTLGTAATLEEAQELIEGKVELWADEREVM